MIIYNFFFLFIQTEAKKRQEEREKNKDRINNDFALAIEEKVCFWINKEILKLFTEITFKTTTTTKKEAELNDERILNEEDLTKPERPDDLDEQRLYESIRDKFAKTRKNPGDPLLSFDLAEESGTITPTAQCSPYINNNCLNKLWFLFKFSCFVVVVVALLLI